MGAPLRPRIENRDRKGPPAVRQAGPAFCSIVVEVVIIVVIVIKIVVAVYLPRPRHRAPIALAE
jgi:hypothetical protein